MKVCAIPVGQAVTANTLYPVVTGASASFASSASFSASFLSIMLKNSSGVFAFNKSLRKPSSINNADNLANACK